MNLKFNNLRAIPFYVVLTLILLFSVYIRTFYYVQGFPFQNDEMLLAGSIHEQNIWSSLVHISGTQKAPPLFVFLSYVFTYIIKFNEYALRFIPFISSITAIFLFYFVSKQIFKNKLTVLIASLLFAINSRLIYYAQDFKPYSSDLLICLLLILLYKYIDLNDFKALLSKKVIFYSIIIFCITSFSFPAAFLICAMFLLKFIEYKKFHKGYIPVLLSFSCACFYIFSVFKHIIINERMESIWIKGFLTLSPTECYNVFKQFFEFNEFYSNVYLILFFIGLLLSAFDKAIQNRLIFLFFLFSCIASFVHLYPISERVSLYLIPIIILFIVKPLDFQFNKTKGITNFIRITLSVIFIIFVFNTHNIKNLMDKNAIIMYASYTQRINNKNDFIKFLNYYGNKELIVMNMEFRNWLFLYNKTLSYNSDFNYIINMYIPEQSYESFLSNNKKIITKADKDKRIWFAYQFSGDAEKTKEDLIHLIKELDYKYTIYKSDNEQNFILSAIKTD